MARERHYESQGPFLFTSDGGTDGILTLQTVGYLKVKQIIKVSAIGQDDLQVEIKRVLSPTKILVGPIDKNFKTKLDMSAYTVVDGASVYLVDGTSKPKLKVDDIWQAVYEQEPVVALRNMLVDQFGRAIASDTDENGNAILKTKTEVEVTGINVNLDSLDNSNPNPDNVLISGSEDGTKTGNRFAYVNNIRLQILSAKDRDQVITYADFGTKNQRVIQIDYLAPSIGSAIARKTFIYSLVGNRYRRDNITWSVV